MGGTFTDFVYWDGARLQVAKQPSTPDDPARAVLHGIQENSWRPDTVVHGSTIATNTLLTRSGVKTGLITTKGFRDTLVIGRQARPQLYARHPTRPPPLIPDALRLEVDERVAADGAVLRPLSEAEVLAVLQRLRRRSVKSLAICLLFSFLNPEHEQRIAAAARACGFDVSVSHEVSPEHREYERMSTTAANAYVAPVMARYLSALAGGLRQGRPPGRRAPSLRIMQSNGGSISAAQAGAEAVRTVLSGPAGGVMGAFAVGQAAGIAEVIGFDMGGTSTDVSLCPGRILERMDVEMGGIPIRVPSVDVHSVGAGGGSIAWLDAGGALHVGPQSAGADPGPAAYDQGGTQPTVTDAHLVLGRLRPDRFLGGQMTLKRARAQQAVAGIAGPFDGDVVAAAQAIIEVVNANIGRALRVISVERGYDPAAFALVAFGGAGPLHACELAEQLGLQRIIIPPAPGVLSASGLLHADVTRDVARGLMLRLPAAGRSLPSGLREAFTALERTARNALAADGYRRGVQFERSADLRYLGQSHELRVPLPRRLSVGIVREALEAAHRERFGHVDPSRDVEIVVARVKARVVGFRPPDGGAPPAIDRTAPKPEMARVVWDRPRPTQIIARRSVGAADVAGPAILTQLDTTILIPPGWRARAGRGGNLLVRKQE